MGYFIKWSEAYSIPDQEDIAIGEVLTGKIED